MKFINICLFSIIILLSSCKKENKTNTLNVSLSGEISTIDPANSYDTISASIVYQGYEQLYEYHYLKRPYTLQPLLAEGMPTIENDGKKYTIKIKKNIQYHDDPAFKGEKRFVTSKDFITQLKRLAYLPTNSNGWWLFDQKIKGINEFREKVGRDYTKFKSMNISGVSAPDDHTLIIELNDPYPQMLYTLAMSFTSPIPIEAVDMYENNLNNKIIGTGPYQLDEWKSSIRLTLKKNQHYRKVFYPGQGDRIANSRNLLADSGKVMPFIEKVEYNVYKEAQTRWLNFKAKKIDYLVIPKDNYSSAVDSNGNLTPELEKEDIKLQIFPTLTYWWLSFNMNDPLLGKNKDLRKAIAHGIDVEKYIKVFTNNIGQKSNSIYPPGIPGYDPSSKLPYEYNTEKAKMYLRKAGYPDGKGLPPLTYDVRGVSATNRQQADFVKSELLKIGINVDVALNTFPGFLEKARQGKLQFWQDGWALDYPDAENVLQLLITRNHAPGPNSTFYSNPKFDKLFNELKVLPNGNKKNELMKEMELIIIDELPWVMQYYSRNYILYHDRLNNYRHSDLIYNNFKYLRLK